MTVLYTAPGVSLPMPEEDLRPKGSVELECTICGWSSWYDALSPEVERAARGEPHVCGKCRGEPELTEKEG